MFAAKLAILLQIKNLFTAYQRNFVYWSVQILIVAHFIGYLVKLLGTIFACSPRGKVWKPELPGTCLNMDISSIAPGALNLVSDVTVLLLPVYIIARLNIKIKARINAMSIFGTGTL